MSLDRKLSPDALVRRIEARQPRLRRYAQRIVPAPLSLAYPTWEDDPEFDAARHVHRRRAPGLGERELCAVLEGLMAKPLDRDRPLWEAHLIDGVAGGGTALLLKVHHCMVDGVSGVSLLEVLLDERPRARSNAPAPSFRAQEPTPTPLRAAQALAVSVTTPLRGAAAMLGALLHPGRIAVALRGVGEWARAIRGEAHPLPWNTPLGPHRSLAFTRLPLADARSVRTAHGGTVNDVVLTALAGGLRRYLQARGLRRQFDSVTALVPVSLRAPGAAATPGNCLSALRVPLALGPASELDRLAAIFATTERLKARRAFETPSACWLPSRSCRRRSWRSRPVGRRCGRSPTCSLPTCRDLAGRDGSPGGESARCIRSRPLRTGWASLWRFSRTPGGCT